MPAHICLICGESKDPSKAGFEHRRVGLDEPPEPVVCECRDRNTIFDSVMSKFRAPIIDTIDNTMMETLPNPSPNMVIVESIRPVPVREVELRLDADLAKLMYIKMDKYMNTRVVCIA